jgi:hypothetical protein
VRRDRKTFAADVLRARITRAAWAAAVGVAVVACGPASDGARPDTATARDSALPSPPIDSSAIRAASATLVLDPATIKIGDTLGGLRVAHVDISKAAEDMGYVGDVRFDGEVTISGDRMTHPDFPDVKEVCMTVDSASATRLPRFPGDGRRRWLCFENRDAAARQVGEAGTRGALTVVIDRYQTVRHFTDAYDTATFVRLVEDRRER